MILKSPKSRLSISNLFADYILSKIPKENQSIIQVIDCINFYVIKGKTTYNQPLNIGEIITDFKTDLDKNHQFLISTKKLSNTIDLIEYNIDLTEQEELVFTYHNTENCSYHHKQIDEYKQDENYSYEYNFNMKKISDDNLLSYCSEFPHGYSLGQWRLLYYYGKHIFYNLPTNYPITTLTFTISKKSEEKFLVHNDERITSAILDMFDFDMKWLEKEIKKVDWSIELINPLEDYDFLKKRIKDFIFI